MGEKSSKDLFQDNSGKLRKMWSTSKSSLVARETLKREREKICKITGREHRNAKELN
jgi:hypothetical protein